MSIMTKVMPDEGVNVPRRRWLKKAAVLPKCQLSRYHPDETGPGDHYLSEAAMHLRDALYLHGASKCQVFPLSNGVLTLLAVRDEDGIRKYTLLVRVLNTEIQRPRIIVQDGFNAGAILHLNQSFTKAPHSEMFVEDPNPDFTGNVIDLHYTLSSREETKRISLQPYKMI